MYAFTFEAPSYTAAAAQLIAQGGKLLAGGQSLLPSMRLRLANPEKIVDLNGVAELAGIRRESNALVIGAMTRHMDVAASSEVKAAIRFPIPKRAAYMKFKQPASRFSLVGVFVAQFDAGVRVAVTGA